MRVRDQDKARALLTVQQLEAQPEAVPMYRAIGKACAHSPFLSLPHLWLACSPACDASSPNTFGAITGLCWSRARAC